jgi:hypothetical protein
VNKVNLTEQERNFAIGYMYEQLYGEGPAFKWVKESGVAHGEVQPFTLHFSKERGVNRPLPPKPNEYPVPWKSVEEFRARAAELRATLGET